LWAAWAVNVQNLSVMVFPWNDEDLALAAYFQEFPLKHSGRLPQPEGLMGPAEEEKRR
jgi:hypothetical protein